MIFLITLLNTIHHHSNNNDPSTIPTPDGPNNPLGLNKNILHLLFIHACVPLNYFVFCYGLISSCNILWMIGVSEECSQ